jgi:hypothetical protein
VEEAKPVTFDPHAPPCDGCGRELDECHCPSLHPALDDDWDPLDELTGYDPDWDDYEQGDLHDDNGNENGNENGNGKGPLALW